MNILSPTWTNVFLFIIAIFFVAFLFILLFFILGKVILSITDNQKHIEPTDNKNTKKNNTNSNDT